MALGPEMIDFIRLQLIEQFYQIYRVCQISVVQEEPDPMDVRILVEVIDPRGIKRAGPPDDSMHLISFVQKQVRQVRSILAGDPSNKSLLHLDFAIQGSERGLVK